MDRDDLRDLLAERPFKPLRLHLTDGTNVDILHSELAVLIRFKLTLYTLSREPGIMDKDVHISLMHIVKAEHKRK